MSKRKELGKALENANQEKGLLNKELEELKRKIEELTKNTKKAKKKMVDAGTSTDSKKALDTGTLSGADEEKNLETRKETQKKLLSELIEKVKVLDAKRAEEAGKVKALEAKRAEEARTEESIKKIAEKISRIDIDTETNAMHGIVKEALEVVTSKEGALISVSKEKLVDEASKRLMEVFAVKDIYDLAGKEKDLKIFETKFKKDLEKYTETLNKEMVHAQKSWIKKIPSKLGAVARNALYYGIKAGQVILIGGLIGSSSFAVGAIASRLVIAAAAVLIPTYGRKAYNKMWPTAEKRLESIAKKAKKQQANAEKEFHNSIKKAEKAIEAEMKGMRKERWFKDYSNEAKRGQAVERLKWADHGDNKHGWEALLEKEKGSKEIKALEVKIKGLIEECKKFNTEIEKDKDELKSKSSSEKSQDITFKSMHLEEAEKKRSAAEKELEAKKASHVKLYGHEKKEKPKTWVETIKGMMPGRGRHTE